MNITTLTVGTLNIGQAAFDSAPAPLSAQIDVTGAVLTVTYTEAVTGSGTGHTLNSGTLGSPSGSGTTRTFSITPVVYEGQTRTLSITSTNLVDGAAQAMEDVVAFPIENLSEEVPAEADGGGDFPLTMGSGTATYDTGYDGQAFVGNGSRWAQAADITALALNDEWEISCRFKTSDATTGGTILTLGGSFYIATTAGGAVGFGYNGAVTNPLSATGFNDGNWHYARAILAAVGDEPSAFYLDEVLVDTDAGERNATGSTSFKIGANFIGGGQFTGLIDEVRIRRNGSTYAYWKLDGTLDPEIGGPAIYSDSTDWAHENNPYHGYQILATGSPTSYAATGLPAGLSINTGTGAITGTPTESGSFAVDIEATNASGTGNATVTITCYAELGWCVDGRISGASADLRDGSNLPNASSLVYPADVTGLGVAWPAFSGRLLTREHYLTTYHAYPGYVTFYEADGTAHVRYLNLTDCDAPYRPPGGSDNLMWHFKTALPAGITPLRVVSNSLFNSDIEGRFQSLVTYGRTSNLCRVYTSTGGYGIASPSDSVRSPLAGEPPFDGTSGSHIGALYDDGTNVEAVTIGLIYEGSGAFSPGGTPEDLNSWINSSGNPNSLTVTEFAYPP